MQPNDNTPVHVIVRQKPNEVWAICEDQIHYAKWRTIEPGERGGMREVEGNESLLNAAMYAWDGQSHFTMPYEEIVGRSGGWGVQWPS